MASLSDANDDSDLQFPEPLQLWDSQKIHFARILGILNKHYAYYDTSETGAGKTHVTIAIAIAFRLSLFVVAPLSLIPMWKEMAKKYGVKIVTAITYDKLRGVNGKCTHGYLGTTGNNNCGHELYMATNALKEVIQDGVLVVFDESHRLKNIKTKNHASAHAIVNAVVGSGSRSRICCLSASPADNIDQAESLLKLMGVILMSDLYIYDRSANEYTPTGIEQAFLYCNRLDPDATHSIYDRSSVSRYTVNRMCYDFFVDIIRKHQASSMKKPVLEASISIRNMFCRVTRKEAEELLAVRERIIKDTGYDKGKGVFVTDRGAVLKIMMGVHQHIEFIKLRIFIRLALTRLKYTTNDKVLIYVWYTQSITKLKEELAEYNPMILNGSVPVDKRAEVIANFQRPDNEHRLIIANVRVGGVGLSLDDTDGRFPRTQLVSPAYRMTDLHQSSGRIYRGTTKSLASVRFIYANNFKEEARIILALQKKSTIARSVLYNDEGVILPGDYEEYNESVYDTRQTFLLSIQRMRKLLEEGMLNDDEPICQEYHFFKQMVSILPRDIIYEITIRINIPFLEEENEEVVDGYDPVFGHRSYDNE
jgi:Helicase conserved C-terminal domain/Type III restriction enzyme, res subunit